MSLCSHTNLQTVLKNGKNLRCRQHKRWAGSRMEDVLWLHRSVNEKEILVHWEVHVWEISAVQTPTDTGYVTTSTPFNYCSAGSWQVGPNKVEGNAAAGFITLHIKYVYCLMLLWRWDVRCRLSGEEPCSGFIVRSCDPFHGAEYWTEWLTSNTPARCRLLTALTAEQGGRGVGSVLVV